MHNSIRENFNTYVVERSCQSKLTCAPQNCEKNQKDLMMVLASTTVIYQLTIAQESTKTHWVSGSAAEIFALRHIYVIAHTNMQVMKFSDEWTCSNGHAAMKFTQDILGQSR